MKIIKHKLFNYQKSFVPVGNTLTWGGSNLIMLHHKDFNRFLGPAYHIVS